MKLLKSILILIFVSCSIDTATAQSAEPAVGRVLYHFTHKRDTNNLKKEYSENMILFMGKTSSMYKSYDRFLHDSTVEAQIKTSGTPNLQAVGPLGSGTVIILHPNEKLAVQQDFLVNNYVYPIEYPVINWQIKNDTTTIAGQKCQKAIGSWKGRTYEVWFCPDIPFRFGPWKLIGLPGLVMRANDLKHQVGFEFLKFQSDISASILIKPKDDAIKTTKEGYHKLHDAFYDDPIAFIKSSMPAGTEITPSTPYVKKPPINNPLELERK